MKKHIKKLSILIALLGWSLLQTQVFAADDAVVAAINKLRVDLLQALNSATSTSTTSQLAAQFDRTFAGTFDSSGKPTGLSTIGKQAEMFTKYFYSWYLTDEWYKTKAFSDMDFSSKLEDNKKSIQKLIAQEIGYNNQKSLKEKAKDSNLLLAQNVESDSNNINPAIVDLDIAPSKDYPPPTPYGSMDSSSPAAENAPSVNDLIGPDGYANEKELNKAKLFISYILKAMPPARTFYIPSKKEANNDGDVTIYLPYPGKDKKIPYTEVKVSTKSGSGVDKDKNDSEYDDMVKFLTRDVQYFQKYKMKTRVANALRTLYLESLFRPFQERTKDYTKEKDKSLVEREKTAAAAGLDKKYYEDLKNKTVAEINIETLYAINKLAYFIYKIHQDIERSSLLVATGGMSSTLQDSQDETTYIKPIGTLIENQCWGNKDKMSADRKQACENPAASTSSASSGT